MEDEPGETRVEDKADHKRIPARFKPGKRRTPASEIDWTCIQDMYETGGYSQRQLAEWAKARGIAISQSAISRRIHDREWLKASHMERIRKEVQDAQLERIGEGLRSMLDQHNRQADLLTSEVLQHFRRAADLRKVDPGYVWPAISLATTAQTLRMAQEMQARSMGWDYKSGRPYRPDETSNDIKPQVLQISVLSPTEESEIRAALEKSIEDGEA